MYYIESSNRGYSIYYENDYDGEVCVSDNLSQNQAEKWCRRLNKAYNMGHSDGSY